MRAGKIRSMILGGAFANFGVQRIFLLFRGDLLTRCNGKMSFLIAVVTRGSIISGV